LLKFAAQTELEDFLAAMTEPGDKLLSLTGFHRGDPKQPKRPFNLERSVFWRLLSPANQSHLAEKKSRLPDSAVGSLLARWLTSGRQSAGCTGARVNRAWLDHFGRASSAPLRTLGLWRAAIASRPARLAGERFCRAWLALKAVAQMILLSTCIVSPRAIILWVTSLIRQSSYWRKPVLRLDAKHSRFRSRDKRYVEQRHVWPPVPVRPDVHGQIVVGSTDFWRQQNAGRGAVKRTGISAQRVYRSATQPSARDRLHAFRCRRLIGGELRSAAILASPDAIIDADEQRVHPRPGGAVCRKAEI